MADRYHRVVGIRYKGFKQLNDIDVCSLQAFSFFHQPKVSHYPIFLYVIVCCNIPFNKISVGTSFLGVRSTLAVYETITGGSLLLI